MLGVRQPNVKIHILLHFTNWVEFILYLDPVYPAYKGSQEMFSQVSPMVMNICCKVGRVPDYLFEPSVLGLTGFKLRPSVKY